MDYLYSGIYTTTQDYAFLLFIFLCLITLSSIVIIVNYLLIIYPFYTMFKRANLKYSDCSFIPIFNNFKAFNLANLSAWYVFLGCIPVLGVPIRLILTCYVNYQIAKNFGLDTIGCILSIFFPVIIYWYITLTKKEFIGKLDSKFIENEVEVPNNYTN